MTTATKWALAAGVLVLAVVVALLPRDEPTHSTGRGAPDLTAARAKAALPPCPPGPGAPVPGLGRVRVTCLGDGRQVDLGETLSGGTTLVNVWATWCQPCTRELPVLAEYAARPGAAKVLALQVASSQADGLDLLARLGVRLPSVHDGDGPAGDARTALKAPPTLPASYLVTPGGVRFVENPRVFESADQVAEVVRSAR